MQDVARELLSIIDQRIKKLFSNLLKSDLHLEDYATVATVSPLTVYINDSTVAVPCGNPRGLALSVGDNIWVVYPNGNQSLKYADRGVSSKYTVDINANKAIGLANKAQADATLALAGLADIGSSNKVTSDEKVKILKPRWDIIVSEKVNFDARVLLYPSDSVTESYGVYTNSYNNLNGYLTPVLVDLTQTSTISREDLNSNFNSYYNSRTTLLNNMESSEKDYVQNALTTANNAASTANSASLNSYTAMLNASNAVSTANSAVTTSNSYTDQQLDLLKIWIDDNYVKK